MHDCKEYCKIMDEFMLYQGSKSRDLDPADVLFQGTEIPFGDRLKILILKPHL